VGSVEQTPGADVDDETREAFEGYTGPELANKSRPLVRNPQALTASLDVDLPVDQIQIARDAVDARDAVVGGWGGKKVGRTYSFWDRATGTRATLDEAGLIRSVDVVGLDQVAAEITADARTGVSLALEGF